MTSVRRVKGKGHLEDVGADEGGDGLGGLEVLAGDDGEVGDDGLGVEGELPERGPVLAEQLVDQRLLGGAIGGSGGGCARRGFLAPPGSGPAADLRAEAEASMGTAEAEARMTGGWAVGGRQARVWGAWERERAGELGFARRVA